MILEIENENFSINNNIIYKSIFYNRFIKIKKTFIIKNKNELKKIIIKINLIYILVLLRNLTNFLFIFFLLRYIFTFNNLYLMIWIFFLNIIQDFLIHKWKNKLLN